MTDDRGVATLASELSASTAADRAAAAEALRARADSEPAAVAGVADDLDAGLTDVDDGVRADTTAAVAEAADADPTAVAALSTHLGDRLSDDEPAVCHHAAYALARVAAVDAVAVEPALPALADVSTADDEPLAGLAVHALAAAADTDPTVFAGLDDATLTGLRSGLVAAADTDDATVRRRAVHALARLAEADVVAPPTPETVVPSVADDTAATRRDATFLLARAADGDPAAVAPHVDTLVDSLAPPDHGAVVVHAVAAVETVARETPAPVAARAEPVAALLTHDRPDVRANAAAALGRVATETDTVADAVETLAERLADDAAAVRVNAAFALAALAAADPDAAKPAMEPLLGRLEDETEREQVRAHAGTALDRLRSALSPAPEPVSAEAADDGVPRGAAAVTDGNRGVGGGGDSAPDATEPPDG